MPWLLGVALLLFAASSHAAPPSDVASTSLLQPHAYAGDQRDRQLDDAMHRFLGDRSRNRYDPARNVQASAISPTTGSRMGCPRHDHHHRTPKPE
jgi:hypothetical protein